MFNGKSIINDSNIDLTYPEFVKYIINKITIYVNTHSENFPFDAEEHYSQYDPWISHSPEIAHLVENISLTRPAVEYLPKVKNPGDTVENKYEPIFNVPEEGYMDNFEIIYRYGTLSISDELYASFNDNQLKMQKRRFVHKKALQLVRYINKKRREYRYEKNKKLGPPGRRAAL